jgi:PAS domain S-box-containing protein
MVPATNIHFDQQVPAVALARREKFFQEAEMIASRDLNDHFRILFEAAPNGVMAVDGAGCIIQLNAQMERMFGYSREELMGRLAELLVPVRFRQRHASLRKKFAATPQTRLMGTGRDLFGVRKDGSEFAVEIGLNSTLTGMGNVVIATVVDITERKRAADEENVHERVRKKVQIFQQIGMPATILRQDGRVVLTNPLFKELQSQFVLRDDQIEVADRTANEFFKQELASLDRRNHGKIVYPSPVLAASGYPPLIFHLLPMEGSFESTLGILVVTTLDALGVPLTDLVERLFALAPAEARVAALIGAGLSPRQAAEKLGISEGNVRTTLKRVFTKVGVSRQSELAVLLTKLTLR